MKRFSETEKWRDPWFQGLPHSSKLLFLYLIDNCNNAGFYEENIRETCFQLEVDGLQYKGALKGLERGIKGASGWLWIKRFLRHQKNEPLNPLNPAHKQIIELIRNQIERFSGCPGFAAFLAPYKGLFSPIGIGIGIGKGKKRESKERGKPTIEQAKEYGATIGLNNGEVESWFDYFESNGWKVGGKTAMLDWQAAMRNAKRRSQGFSPNRQLSFKDRDKRRGDLQEQLNVMFRNKERDHREFTEKEKTEREEMRRQLEELGG